MVLMHQNVLNELNTETENDMFLEGWGIIEKRFL